MMMKLFYKVVLFLLSSIFVASSFAQSSASSKTLRIIVPFAVGGASDTYTRLVSQKMTEQSGRTVIVENKTGAGGRIAFDYVAHQPADGSTAVLIDATYAMLPGLFNNLTWDVGTDLVPSAFITQTPFVILVRSESSYLTLKDLVSAAKANPNQLNYGSAGVGSTNHIVTERFNASAGITLTHVPFKGMSEAILALQSGNIDFLMPASPTALGQIKGGKIRPIAVTTLKRSPALPNIPTMIESGVANYSATNWFGFAAPKGTSREIVNSLYEDITKALSSNDLREKFMLQGAEVSTLTTDEFSKFIREDTKRWTEVIKNSNIHVD